jgi:hypothetical protein
MDLLQYISEFDRKVLLIKSGMEAKLVKTAGFDMVALVTDRVVQKGVSADGSRFSAYSDRPMNAKKLKGKSRRDSAEKRVQSAIKEGVLMSYREFREINGLKTDKKNFEFTGEMWRKFGVVRYSYSAGKFELVFGGKTAEAKKKLAKNSKREGKDISEPSKSEIKVVVDNLNNWVNSILK